MQIRLCRVGHTARTLGDELPIFSAAKAQQAGPGSFSPLGAVSVHKAGRHDQEASAQIE